jgi:THO complex subunit 4
LSYGPNSQSRGIANVSFRDGEGASKAFQKLNGLLVDGRPIKIEIVVGASQADRFIPTAKTLAERTTLVGIVDICKTSANNFHSQPKSQPKAQPKSAAADKKGAAKTAGKGAKKQRGRNARPAKKTAAELDSEMADYFVAAPNNENAAVAAVAAAPTNAGNGEAMEEIEVRRPSLQDSHANIDRMIVIET